jgi:hypothetical protein
MGTETKEERKGNLVQKRKQDSHRMQFAGAAPKSGTPQMQFYESGYGSEEEDEQGRSRGEKDELSGTKGESAWGWGLDVPMAKMKVMTPRQTLRIIFLPLVPPLPRPAPPLPLLASEALLEDRGKEELPCCSCGRNAPPDGSMAQQVA